MSQEKSAFDYAWTWYKKLRIMKQTWYCHKCGRWCPNCNGRSCDKCCIHGFVGWHHCPYWTGCRCYESGPEQFFEKRTMAVRVPDSARPTSRSRIGPIFGGPPERLPRHPDRPDQSGLLVYKLRPGAAVLLNKPRMEQRGQDRLHVYPKTVDAPSMAVGTKPPPDQHSGPDNLQVTGTGVEGRRRWDAHCSRPARLGLLTRSSAFELPTLPGIPQRPATVCNEVLGMQEETEVDYDRDMERRHFPAFFSTILIDDGIY